MKHIRPIAMMLSAVFGGMVAAAATPGVNVVSGERYVVDPVHSTVIFRIRHMNVAAFYGRFNQVSGEFVWDDEHPENSTFSIAVETESVDTNNADRDKHLKSPDFFNVDKNAQLKFVSKSAKRVGEGAMEVAGTLSLGDASMPLTVRIEKIGAGPDIWGGYRCGFETQFTIKRSDLGLRSHLEPVGPKQISTLGDEVRLIVAIEGVRQ